MTDRKPRVVIVGRPNVGKSTLFNRLLGRHRAITAPLPGVTRDVIEEDCSLGGILISLIDTGGIKADPDGDFDSLVADRARLEMKNADVILFVLELGIKTAEDQFITDELRVFSSKVILAVNKADSIEKDCMAWEFEALGMGNPISISAVHGRNMDLLKEAMRKQLKKVWGNDAGNSSETGDDGSLVLTIVGRPNAGKSTLLNQMIGKDSSLVSEIAGTTRDVVIGETQYRDRSVRIIDTAGMRRRTKVAGNVEYYSVNRAVRSMSEADVTILLIDVDAGLTDQDKKIAALALKKGKSIVIVINKWDEENPDPKRLETMVDRIHFQFPVLEWAPIMPVSAIYGYNISKLLDLVIEADQQQSRRVDTAELNRAKAEWVDLTPPPSRNGRSFRIKYITQVSTRPIRFVAFVNRKTGFPDSYRRFLVNQIRRDFSFNLVPVILELREGKK